MTVARSNSGRDFSISEKRSAAAGKILTVACAWRCGDAGTVAWLARAASVAAKQVTMPRCNAPLGSW